MAVPQRDNSIEAIKRLEPPSRVRCGVSGALLEYAVMHGDEAERIREERIGGCVGFAEGCGSRGATALPKWARRFGGVANLHGT